VTEVRRKQGLEIRSLPDGDAVVAGHAGSDAVIINASAHAVLEMLSESCSEQAIVELFCQTFPDQDPAAVQRDVTTILQDLVRAGILERCGGASSTA
jgi:hypothetical protein